MQKKITMTRLWGLNFIMCTPEEIKVVFSRFFVNIIFGELCGSFISEISKWEDVRNKYNPGSYVGHDRRVLFF